MVLFKQASRPCSVVAGCVATLAEAKRVIRTFNCAIPGLVYAILRVSSYVYMDYDGKLRRAEPYFFKLEQEADSNES